MAVGLRTSSGRIIEDTGGSPESLTITGNLTVGGTLTTTGGIAQEQISFTAGEMAQSGLTTVLTSGVPRITLADAATNSVYVNISPPNWWLGFNIIAAVVNDHSAGGNVRIQARVRETDYATETVSTGALILDSTTTQAAPSANGGLSFFVVTTGITRTPGVFGSLYSVEFTRLGSDGADTLAGPYAIAGLTVGRV